MCALVTIVLQDTEDAVEIKVFSEPDLMESGENTTHAQAAAFFGLRAIEYLFAADEEDGEPEIPEPDPDDPALD